MRRGGETGTSEPRAGVLSCGRVRNACPDVSRRRSVLRAELDAHSVDTLLLAGCWTESCVLSTAVRAVAEDLNVAVASDAVFTCADAGPAALRVLGVYCCMVRAAEMSAYLRDLASAGTLAEADATPTAVERTAALPVALAQPLFAARAEPEA